METLEEIWEGDLFRRQEEADDIVGYLESVSDRPQIRDEGHAHVLAVDSPYGQGKSYFLRRLARHMARDHAVAFVDAWVDDLEDQPMVALAATLDKALQPWVQKYPDLGDRMTEFRAVAGRVAKIVGIGLAKRAASFVIMSSGAEALDKEISSLGEIRKDFAKDGIKDASNTLVDAIDLKDKSALAESMEERISRFRDGQQAISDMKLRLGEIVNTLVDAGMKLPITIIVDELDRCRPTYAIKVLEELKHLFDVPGVAFVLGMHGQQLSHSVTAAYGVGFDSRAYLRRFFNRRYVLRNPPLLNLVIKLCHDLKIPLKRLVSPMVSASTDDHNTQNEYEPNLISEYIVAYGLAPRDAFSVLEALQTFMALTGDHPILLPLIMPMIIAHVQGKDLSDTKVIKDPSWVYRVFDNSYNGKSTVHGLQDTFDQMYGIASMDRSRFLKMINSDGVSLIATMAANERLRMNDNDKLAGNPFNYEQTLRRVARFKSG